MGEMDKAGIGAQTRLSTVMPERGGVGVTSVTRVCEEPRAFVGVSRPASPLWRGDAQALGPLSPPRVLHGILPLSPWSWRPTATGFPLNFPTLSTPNQTPSAYV
jgi:hypothetical protein